MKTIHSKSMDRRTFVKTTAATGAGLILSGGNLFSSQSGSITKMKYANVGTGSRSYMFHEAIMNTYSASSEMVGFCDINIGRLKRAKRIASEKYQKDIPVYLADEFDKMIKENKPDVVIVTTMDGVHDKYIIRAMELGCDVITEKPMTIDAQKCQNIINAEKATGKKCKVSFNYRYSPPRTKVKELLMDGSIGEILSVDFHWMLNTFHGADYFRRWHSKKGYSGGLMVHKATHHFDLMNWWLSAIPQSVFATGKREFYTPQMAKRFGLESHHERCYTCPEKSKCGFRLELDKNPGLKELYLDHEKHDGYFRDQCVFRPEIDIEDTMNVLVTYDNNITMTYSLNAFNAWEGYTVIFNGTKGRIEHSIEEKIYINDSETEQGGIKKGSTVIKVIPLRGEAYNVEVKEGIGGHGGGDKVMLDDLFKPGNSEDKFKRAADHRAGAYSILTGIAANISIATGKKVDINDIIKNLDYPDYPGMPSREKPLDMPRI
jgi:predicted dehydrogenase